MNYLIPRSNPDINLKIKLTPRNYIFGKCIIKKYKYVNKFIELKS